MATSPCIGVCEVEDGVCVGCDRTVEDIINWSEMSEARRKERMKELREA